MLDKKIYDTWFSFLENQYGKKDASSREIYFEMLKDIDTDDFKMGIKDLCKNRVYSSFPTVAEIRNYCLGDIETTATLAWGDVYDAITDHGYVASLEFEDKTIHMVIKSIGGWQRICSCNMDKLDFIKKDFINAYKTYFKNPVDTTRYLSSRHGGDVVKIPCDYLKESQKEKLLKYLPTSDRSSKAILSDIVSKMPKNIKTKLKIVS